MTRCALTCCHHWCIVIPSTHSACITLQQAQAQHLLCSCYYWIVCTGLSEVVPCLQDTGFDEDPLSPQSALAVAKARRMIWTSAGP